MGKASASPISKLRLTERVSQMSAGAEDGKRGTFREKEESSKRWPGVTFHLLEVIGLPVFWEAGHVWKRWWGGRRLEAGGTCWWAAVADMQRRPRQTAGKRPSGTQERIQHELTQRKRQWSHAAWSCCVRMTVLLVCRGRFHLLPP